MHDLADARPPATTLREDIRAGLAGEVRDHTQGSMGRSIVILSIPMVLEMSMQSVFGVVDVFFVAKLGSWAVAAVGLTDSLLTLVFGIAMGLSMAATATVARRIGEKKPKEAAISAVQAILLGTLVSLVLAIAGTLNARNLLNWMGASEEILAGAVPFTALMLGGNITVMLLFLINAAFRGAGDASVAMRSLWLANLINILLDPVLIFGFGPIPALGLTGAAIATNLGRGIGILYQIRKLLDGRGSLKIEVADIRLQLPVLIRLLKVSVPGIVQQLIATASWLGMMRIVAIFGSTALAGYTIAVRIIVFALLPSWGMGNAAATLVGQNLGARKPGRAERSVWVTAFCNMVFLSLVGIWFYLRADFLAGLFASQGAVLETTASCLRIVSYGFPLLAFGMVTVQAFNGAGDTVTPTWINLLSYWLFQIPLAYVLSVPLGYGTEGAFLAIPIAQSFLALLGVWWFRRGQWKTLDL